jgi:4-hydroxy-3-polyprenylbenzoate decarboxylase
MGCQILPPETSREWGRKIAMDPYIIKSLTEKWERLGLSGSGKPVWR